MSISYPLAFPTITGLRGVNFRLRKIVGMAASPFNVLARTTYEWPGNEAWECDITLPPMNRADGRAWLAWLASLDAQVGSFTMGDPDGTAAMGAASATPGTPQVDGAQAVRSKTLAIKTGLGAVANYLRAGDWISLGSGATRRLYMNLQDVTLASDGRATLEIRPALRYAAGDGDTVAVASCPGLFSLSQNAIDQATDVARMYRAGTIQAVEATLP